MVGVTEHHTTGAAPTLPWSFEAFREQGLLWLVNRTVFHPRGFALAFEYGDDSAEPVGWTLHGDGSEVWRYGGDVDEDHLFSTVEALFRAAHLHVADVNVEDDE